MKKTYKVTVTNETLITVDVDDNTSNDELLDKVENELDKGFIGDITYFEVEGEVETDE